MSKAEDERQVRLGRAREIGLFRYMLVRGCGSHPVETGAWGDGACHRRAVAHRSVRAGREADPLDVGPLDPGLAPRWVRRLGPQPTPVPAAYPAAGAGVGFGVEEGEPGPHCGADPPDPACAAGLGTG